VAFLGSDGIFVAGKVKSLEGKRSPNAGHPWHLIILAGSFPSPSHDSVESLKIGTRDAVEKETLLLVRTKKPEHGKRGFRQSACGKMRVN
jgi:hypothetical protein